MPGHWMRNSAVVAIAISLVSTASAFWVSSIAGRRDQQLGQHNRDLALVQAFALSCERATRLAADCARGVERPPTELVTARDACASDWQRLRRRASPDLTPRIDELEAVATPLRASVGAVTAQCLGGSHEPEALAKLSAAEPAFRASLTPTLRWVEEQTRAARRAWDRAHRQIQLIALLSGVWALLLAGIMALALRRMLQTRNALDSEKFRALELDAFASRAAHDLRGMLTPLPIIAASILRAGEDTQRLESLARRLEGTSRRATRMIDALLAFARLGHASNPAPTPVAKVLGEVLLDLEPLVRSVGAEVHTEQAEGAVTMEAPLLYAVLMNLVTNSLKFMRGQPQRVLTVETRRLDGMLELVVKDTGPGIPKHELPRVFELFYRAKTLEAAPGAGIGLTSVARLVEAHGGTTRMESVVGEGTRVIVALPDAGPPASQRALSETSGPEENQPPAG